MIIRPFKWQDLTAVVAVINKAQEALGREPEATEARIRHQLRRYFAAERDCFVAESHQGLIVGVATMRFLHPPGTGLGVHSSLPEEREDQIGRALVRVTDAHLLDAWVDKLPPDRPIVSFRDAYVAEAEKSSMYAAEHYLKTGSTHTMEKRPEVGLAVSSLPDGVALGPFDKGRDAEKLYEMMREVSGSADYRSYENWRDHYHVDEAWFDPSMWTLAWEADQIVGLAICFPDIYEEPHQTGWIDWIGVRTERRKAGIGRRLLEQSVVNFQKRSFSRIKARVPSDLGPALMASLTSSGWHIQFTKLTFEKELDIGEFSLHSLGDTD